MGSRLQEQTAVRALAMTSTATARNRTLAPVPTVTSTGALLDGMIVFPGICVAEYSILCVPAAIRDQLLNRTFPRSH
jgi:hypothetical protein